MEMKVYHSDGRCPKCGEYDDLDCDWMHIDRDSSGEVAWHSVTCNSCGCEFVEVYRFDHAEVYE